MKSFKKAISAIAASSVLAASTVLCAFAGVDVSAKAAILVESSTGTVLFEKNADERLLIASTTKLMTALVAIENASLDDVVSVAPECQGVEGSSLYLKAGDKLTMRELLYGLMLESGNDAAVAVACHVAGSVEKFAELMNERAASLGLENTHFVNPHGLNAEGHYSSARDLAKIMAEGMRDPLFAQIASTRSISFGARKFSNHNKLMWSYDGMVAGKTGFTKKAGRTLVTCAERQGLRLICVTLNDGDDWNDHSALYDMGFASWEMRRVAGSGETVGSVPVISGKADFVKVRPAYPVTVAVPRDAELDVTLELPEFVYAEVREGRRAGTMRVSAGGETLAEAELVYAEDVARVPGARPGLFERLR